MSRPLLVRRSLLQAALARQSRSFPVSSSACVASRRYLAEKADKEGASASKDATSDGAAPSSGPFTSFVNMLKTLKAEFIDKSDYFKKAEPYVPPVDRRRASIERPARQVEANDDETAMVMHKESRWESQWNQFKENNPVANSLFDLRMKFDESDNIIVRGARAMTDTVGEKLKHVFEEDESAAVLQEIQKMDPTFDKHKFLMHCEKNVIPAVLEAFIAGDLETLRDWCAEPCYKAMENIIEHRRQSGLVLESQILDLGNVEFLMAKHMNEGPVLIMSFICQQTKCVRDRTGAIIEGGEDNVQQCIYVFAMRRDPEVFDPLLAWQVLEIGEQFSQEII